MKLCRYGKNGYEKPGIIDAEGRLRDLSKVVESIGPKEISPRGLKMLAKVKPEKLPIVLVILPKFCGLRRSTTELGGLKKGILNGWLMSYRR